MLRICEAQSFLLFSRPELIQIPNEGKGWRACELLWLGELGLRCPSSREAELQVGYRGEVGAGVAGEWCCRQGRVGLCGGWGGCFGGLRVEGVLRAAGGCGGRVVCLRLGVGAVGGRGCFQG
ncbi:hypothetical protein SUGI_0512810 [Cryptomeria japonica]|nr:hypothetical protein SUGI_0512810 [Cryptomeria japonica]